MSFPYGYQGSSYLGPGSFNSILLGRMDYGGGGGYGRSPLSYTQSGLLSPYSSPYTIGSSSYQSNKYLSEHGSPGLGRRLKGLTRLPSLRPDKLAVFHTENIDVTTPRSATKPKEISRDRQESYDGTIHRGRTVIRMETQHLKDNPSLEFPQPKKKPKKTAGQKLKEKYLVGSVKKRKNSGYRRPTLNDLRLKQGQEEVASDRALTGSPSPPITDEENDYYFKPVAVPPTSLTKPSSQTHMEDGIQSIVDELEVDDSIACDHEIEEIFKPGAGELVSQCFQDFSEIQENPSTEPKTELLLEAISEEEPEVFVITLKKRPLQVLAEEEGDDETIPSTTSLELPTDTTALVHEMESLDLTSDRRLNTAIDFHFTIPLPNVQPYPTAQKEEEDNDYRQRWTYHREPENPDDFWGKYNTPDRDHTLKKPSLKLSIPPAEEAAEPADSSPTPTFYVSRSINTILEKSESQEAEDENNFDFWGNEKRPSYHCMRRPMPVSRQAASPSPENVVHENQSHQSQSSHSEESLLDFWGSEKRPSYHRLRTSANRSNNWGCFNSRSSIHSQSHATMSSPPNSSNSTSPVPSGHFKESTSKSPSPNSRFNSSKKSTDSGFFDSSPKTTTQPIREKKPSSQVITKGKAKFSWKNVTETTQVPHCQPLKANIEKAESVKTKTNKLFSKTKTEETESNSVKTTEISKEAITSKHKVKTKIKSGFKKTEMTETSNTSTVIEKTKEIPATSASPTSSSETCDSKILEPCPATFEKTKTTTVTTEESSKTFSTSSSLKNPTIERLKKQSLSESSESSGCSFEGSCFDDDSPDVTPKSSIKEGSASTSSSTLSAGTSSGSSSRRMPSPPSEDDSEDEASSLKGKSDESFGESRTCPSKGRPKYRTYHLNDFQFLKVLGKGSFGKVLLAELKGTDSYFAIKCLKKDVVLEDDDVECTMVERKVLLIGSKHPYLCHLLCTFQSESHLFFAMEYLNGGDLMFHIQHDGRFTEERARFYGAEIVSGLKFLHKKGVIYRDLKLDNILLDYEGHVRIADFGMCKLQIFLDRTADTFCGTPDYMAPEIVKGVRYNQCVDWWAFGVLLYEMLVGQSPFSGADEDELFWSICNEPVHFPRFLSQYSKRILELLLEKDGYRRLGSPGSIHGDIKDTVFFVTIDWDRLERRELEPPFKPKLRDPLDVKYFDTTFTKEVARLTPVDKQILRSMDQSQFDGFSYTNPHTTD